MPAPWRRCGAATACCRSVSCGSTAALPAAVRGSCADPAARSTDAGAVAARRRGNSLLPVGVVRVDGGFARGDAVIVRGPDGTEIGRGLVAYDAADAEKLRGRPSGDIPQVLGIDGRAEMIHRDDLVLGRQ